MFPEQKPPGILGLRLLSTGSCPLGREIPPQSLLFWACGFETEQTTVVILRVRREWVGPLGRSEDSIMATESTVKKWD